MVCDLLSFDTGKFPHSASLTLCSVTELDEQQPHLRRNLHPTPSDNTAGSDCEKCLDSKIWQGPVSCLGHLESVCMLLLLLLQQANLRM